MLRFDREYCTVATLPLKVDEIVGFSGALVGAAPIAAIGGAVATCRADFDSSNLKHLIYIT